MNSPLTSISFCLCVASQVVSTGADPTVLELNEMNGGYGTFVVQLASEPTAPMSIRLEVWWTGLLALGTMAVCRGCQHRQEGRRGLWQ